MPNQRTRQKKKEAKEAAAAAKAAEAEAKKTAPAPAPAADAAPTPASAAAETPARRVPDTQPAAQLVDDCGLADARLCGGILNAAGHYEDKEGNPVYGFATFHLHGGFKKAVENLHDWVMKEAWRNDKGELGMMFNYLVFSFKYIVTTQASKIKFSEDGTWAAYNTRLLSRRGTGLKPIYALFQKNTSSGCQPYCFKGWRHNWDPAVSRIFGSAAPEPFSTEESTNEQPSWWKDFNEKLPFRPAELHILGDNIERLREIHAPSADAPLHEKCWLFLGHSLDRQTIEDFLGKKLVEPLCFRGSGLAYAKFASYEVAKKMKIKCRGQNFSDFGETSCKPILCLKPPTEKEVEEIGGKLSYALACAERYAKLNPRSVLPQLYHPGGCENGTKFKRQLLLPLHFNSDEEADAALTVELEPDKSTGGWMYTASTVLTLDMALTNARLVCSVESQWLKPTSGS